MSKFLHDANDDGNNDDNDDAKALAIPQIFSKTAKLINLPLRTRALVCCGGREGSLSLCTWWLEACPARNDCFMGTLYNTRKKNNVLWQYHSISIDWKKEKA